LFPEFFAMGRAFEKVLESGCILGESPVWLADSGTLLFVDIKGRRIHRFHPGDGAHESCAVDEDIGCIAPVKGGGMIAGLRSGLWLLDASGNKIRMLAGNPEDPFSSRFNDGRVDPRGRYLAGTVDELKAGGRAGLYRYDRRGLARLARGLLTSNGLAFSPDGRTLYHADTPRFTVYRHDYDPETGDAENRRVFIEFDRVATGGGRPDGAAVDADGCYWTALYDGGCVQRFSPEGEWMASHPTPASRPTMPAFGGADLKTLYVTSARDESTDAGGNLFVLAVDAPGLQTGIFDPDS
jgi:sugar lactone lactonase YvrE